MCHQKPLDDKHLFTVFIIVSWLFVKLNVLYEVQKEFLYLYRVQGCNLQLQIFGICFSPGIPLKCPYSGLKKS